MGNYPTTEAATGDFTRFQAIIVATHQFRERLRDGDTVYYSSLPRREGGPQRPLAIRLWQDYKMLHLTCINLDLQTQAFRELPPELQERWRQMQATH